MGGSRQPSPAGGERDACGTRGHLNRVLPALLVVALTGCGYHVGGMADALPKNIHTIAIPAFKNVTTQYKVSDMLGAAVTREFISRTRYAVTADPEKADAILTGSVVNFISYPTIFDPNRNRATGVQASVIIQVTLRDRVSGAILYNRPNFEVHERYEISIDPKNYFDENEPAMQRLAQDVARSIVSAVLEKF